MKKIFKGLLGTVLGISALVGVTSCGSDEAATSQVTTTASKPLLPLDQREGYTTKYQGFTGVVHRVKNTTNNNEIYGRIFRPDNFDENKKYPLLIMSHGYNSVSMDGNSGMVQYAIKQGMICYTYDFCGGGKLSKSDGKPIEMSVKTEITDLESVLADLKGFSYVDTSKIVLFGHSFGGLVTSLTATSHKDEIAAVVLHAPAINMGDNARETYSSLDEVPKTQVHNYMEISKKFYEDLWDVYGYQTASQWGKKILLLYGTADDFYKDSSKVQEAFGGPEMAKISIVEGSGHNFSNFEYDTCAPDMEQYFKDMGII